MCLKEEKRCERLLWPKMLISRFAFPYNNLPEIINLNVRAILWMPGCHKILIFRLIFREKV
jgi:hypothetical protein